MKITAARILAVSLTFAVLALHPKPGHSEGLVASSTAPTVRQIRASGAIYERITVHGQALEGNLEGDSPDRNVSVYLPPSYSKARWRRY